MPWIKVDGPKIEDVDKKREFVAKLTDIASGFYGMPKETITIIIKENQPENVGVGGKLVVDFPKK